MVAVFAAVLFVLGELADVVDCVITAVFCTVVRLASTLEPTLAIWSGKVFFDLLSAIWSRRFLVDDDNEFTDCGRCSRSRLMRAAGLAEGGVTAATEASGVLTEAEAGTVVGACDVVDEFSGDAAYRP